MTEIKAPKIYSSDIPDKLIESFNDSSTVMICAPTGEGKTLMLVDILSFYSRNSRSEGKPKKCILVIPTKPAVLAIYDYANKIFKHKIGYRMHDNVVKHPKEDLTIMVTDYFLEYILHNKDIYHKEYIIAVDEAHDSSLQTDLLVRILSWIKLEKNSKIKIIISSATLEIIKYSNFFRDPLILSIPEKKPNVDIHFSDDKSTVKGILLKKNVIGKNILIIAPGEQDIYEIISEVETLEKYEKYAVYPLHSKLTFEEIQEVVGLPGTSEKNIGHGRIIIATNIVENSITLKGLQVVIDLGYRKSMVSDDKGKSRLVTKLAAKSNIIQAAGRVGREDERGTAYVMIPEKIYESLDDFPVSELYDTNVYFHITTLLRGNYPIDKILNDSKLQNNLKRDLIKLYSSGFIESKTVLGLLHDYSMIKLTDDGMLFTKLGLSVDCSRFLINVLRYNDIDIRYTAVIVACFINLQGGLFYKPRKSYKESNDEYILRCKDILSKQKIYIDGHVDSIETLLDIWIADPKYLEAGLYSKNMIMLKKSIQRLCRILEELEFKIDYNIYPFLHRRKLLIDLYNIFGTKEDEVHEPEVGIVKGLVSQHQIKYGEFDKYYDLYSEVEDKIRFPLEIFYGSYNKQLEHHTKLVIIDNYIIPDSIKERLMLYTYLNSDIWINNIFPHLTFSKIIDIIRLIITM